MDPPEPGVAQPRGAPDDGAVIDAFEDEQASNQRRRQTVDQEGVEIQPTLFGQPERARRRRRGQQTLHHRFHLASVFLFLAGRQGLNNARSKTFAG
ncbi:MAG: hypothetical protein Q7U73_11365 [Rubrivivax sp.]|nr:hypothetical protein [Rubrivivax sp.]